MNEEIAVVDHQGQLFLVPTPIGNLEDITIRALRILGEVKLIGAEDTRVTKKLLAEYGINTQMISYHEHNETQRIPHILNILVESDVALVSDAGMPGLSDPGFGLVNEAIRRGISITVLPGPSAITSALPMSGLPIDQFAYVGFLPRRASQRRATLQKLQSLEMTLVVFETPHRVRDMLEDVLAVLGNRGIAVCREISKMYEETFRGTVMDALAYFLEPKGEFTLVIEGANPPDPLDTEIGEYLHDLTTDALSPSEAVQKAMRRFKVPRKRAYEILLSERKN